MDLLEDEPAGNAPEFTVSELSGAVKRTIEGTFDHVRVRGEVGRVSRPRSGHVYLDLKDDRSVIAGVIWKGVSSRLQTQPEEGMEVIATGKLTTFPGQSKYQIMIDDIRPAGMGALMAMLEKRKAQLQAEGLFEPSRKQPLPFLPEVIGVVTSPSGAVIRDILHRLRDRFPRKVLVWPVAVQGQSCATEVARAVNGFNEFTPGGALPRPDLLIVARGGGSVEDLWGFNEEVVARAAAASQIPLISAVGHETDTTLIDYVSDYRAPTPTGAAERAVPVRLDLLATVSAFGARMSQSTGQRIEARKQRLRDVARALPALENLLQQPRQRLDLQAGLLPAALLRLVDSKRLRLSEQTGALRPAIVARAVGFERARLTALGTRQTARPIKRNMAEGAERLAVLNERLQDAMRGRLDQLETQLASLDRLRETLGYRETLRRGYAVVRTEGQVLTSRAAAQGAGSLEIEFADGRIKLGGAPAPKRKGKANPPEQGSLF